MMIPDTLLASALTIALPAGFAWVWRVHTKVTEHEGKFEKLDEVVDKLDQLVTLLLQDRLKQ